MISHKESVGIAEEAVFESLVDISAGDLRRSINLLQTASSFKSQQGLSARDIEKISGVVPQDQITRIDDVLCKSDGLSNVQSLTQDLILEGFDVQQLLLQTLNYFLAHDKLSDLKKAKVAEVIAETDVKLIQGGDEELNLLYTLSTI